MAIEMINQWFGIEQSGGRFLVRDMGGVHTNCASRDDAIGWIEHEMAQIEAQGAEEPEATAEEYLEG